MLSACARQRAYNRRQQGIALLSVLLVFAFASLLIGHLVTAAARDLKRSSNYISARQAAWYAMSGETLARQILYEDLQTDNETAEQGDGLNEAWAQPLHEFPIDQGAMRLQINDLQARFNLNNLIDAQGVARPDFVAQFQRLLEQLDLPDDLALPVVDWLDADTETLSDNPEDELYLEKSPPYLSANVPMADISELRQIDGISEEYYAQLAPYVAALPIQAANKGEPTKINLNTASEQVLRSVAVNTNVAVLQGLLNDRKSRKVPPQEISSSLSATDSTNISSGTEYFEILVAASFDQRWGYLRSVVQRDSQGDMKVLSRSVNRSVATALLKEDEP